MSVLEFDTTPREEAIGDAGVRDLIAQHLGGDPCAMPMLSETWPFFRDVNLQAGLDAYTQAPGRSARTMGLSITSNSPLGMLGAFAFLTLASALSSPLTRLAGIQYEERPCGVDETMLCLRSGLLLIDGPEGPIAVYVREEGLRPQGSRCIDVIAPTIEAASAFLTELRRLMSVHNKFRGHFLRFTGDGFGNVEVHFEPKPHVTRAQVILPESSLKSLEDHAIRIGTQAGQLTRLGRHLKRGLLLYGPPGTGKTHTLRYLSSQLPDATVMVMAGSGMGALPFIKSLLLDLTPAIVVLDDVDLIAEDRALPGMAPRSLLFSLLDAMDGMAEDADVLFVCTSNRVDTLEKAIAARPGRIDQALEVGLPDYSARKRLFSLYRQGMDTSFPDLASVLERTEGVSASFIKELLRRAYLRARAAGETTVTDAHLHQALDVLLDPANPLTPALLGVDEATVMQREKSRGAGTAWCGI